MARGRHFQQRKMITRWGGFNLSTGGLSAGAIGIQVSSAGSIRETILRVRGTLDCYMDALSAPDLGVVVTVGMRLVPEGTGTTVISNPFSDSNNPGWFYMSCFHLAYEEKVTDVIALTELASYRETVDNKAMRLFGPDQEIQLVVVNTTLEAAATIRLAFQGRILFGQH